MIGGSLAPAATAAHTPTWEAFLDDVPARGQPISTRVEIAAAPHRAIVRSLSQLSPGAIGDLAAILQRPENPEQAVRLLAGIVTVHTAFERRPASTAAALRWFLGERGELADEYDRPLETAGWSKEDHGRLVALLPYVLDPFGLTTRRALLAGRACPSERASRKRLGAFYTPGDVARALAAEAITPRTRHVLDPACGAGVFLRAAFTRLASSMPASRAARCLYGVDVDAAAIDACALVLTHDWLMREPLTRGELPVDRFAQIRSRLIAVDALELFAQPAEASLFKPRVNHPPGELPPRFDAILTNPPFAAVGICSDAVRDGFESLRAASRPAGVNMIWPFWELSSRVATRDGRVGIVLPLSATYLTGAAPSAARRAVFRRGAWEMRFFDRAPDALFGDDVKQRVAIALRRPGTPGRIRTSSMRRWSADRRASALGPAGKAVDQPVRADLVLKIGSAIERDAFELLSSSQGTLGDAAARVRLAMPKDLERDACAISVAPTAYNWIGAFRDNELAARARREAAGKLTELVFSDSSLADAAYAAIVSRVFLWWWRATGDLFHVPRSTLAWAPLPVHRCSGDRLDALAAAGRACWLAARDRPVRSVNRGVATVSYRVDAGSRALAVVDRAVGDAFGLNAQFVRFVRDDADRLQEAGRSL